MTSVGLELLARERRQDERRDTFAPGCITFEDGSAPIFCLVHNLSRSGAKLEVAQAIRPSETFLLTIDGEVGMFRAETIWWKDFLIGVRFIGRL